MAFRHIARWPFRAAATTLGIAFGVALLVTALLSFDSVELMIDVAFFRTERQQATLNFTDEKHERAWGWCSACPACCAPSPTGRSPCGCATATSRASCRSSASRARWISPASSTSISSR